MPDLIQQQKKLIRQEIRLLRKSISKKESQLAAQKLAKKLKADSRYRNALEIACFISFDAEINTTPLIEMLFNDGKKVYLPKLKPIKPNRLWFMPYQQNAKLLNNRLGIPEVDLTVNYAIAVSKLDVILMPLVAFDLQGNRLGMGGGFYDATLAHLSGLKKANLQHKPLCIGIAYQQQLVNQLPTENWDIKLDGVLTQDNFYCF